ncbi:MAG: Peptidase T [Saprospiraceae bacterium]|nr:Peptidase T [Saprospiraceae bacterium]
MDKISSSFTGIAERFMRYVRIDTQSDPASTTIPSTQKQLDLSRLLLKELQDAGLYDAELDAFGYVYATLPSNVNKILPSICLCAHVDTAPDCSGSGVIPLIHKNYQLQQISLPDDLSIVIDPIEFPDLRNKRGEDIITASGTTLLGADDKAGVAAIMEAVLYLISHPEIPHGNVRILFTPDEEIGRGVDRVDMKKLAADFGFTLDGGPLGSLSDETFSADAVQINIDGVSAHPGYAAGRMEHAAKISSEIVASLPQEHLIPEKTEGRLGFVHPTKMTATLEKATIDFIIRDFDTAALKQYEDYLNKLAARVVGKYPNSRFSFQVTEQYRNMREILDAQPLAVQLAERAIEEAGLTLQKHPIRGGTDGSRLSFMGLPCPNLFAGEYGIHSKKEWVSVQDMQRAAEVIVRICELNTRHG